LYRALPGARLYVALAPRCVGTQRGHVGGRRNSTTRGGRDTGPDDITAFANGWAEGSHRLVQQFLLTGLRQCGSNPGGPRFLLASQGVGWGGDRTHLYQGFSAGLVNNCSWDGGLVLRRTWWRRTVGPVVGPADHFRCNGRCGSTRSGLCRLRSWQKASTLAGCSFSRDLDSWRVKPDKTDRKGPGAPRTPGVARRGRPGGRQSRFRRDHNYRTRHRRGQGPSTPKTDRLPRGRPGPHTATQAPHRGRQGHPPGQHRVVHTSRRSPNRPRRRKEKKASPANDTIGGPTLFRYWRSYWCSSPSRRGVGGRRMDGNSVVCTRPRRLADYPERPAHGGKGTTWMAGRL